MVWVLVAEQPSPGHRAGTRTTPDYPTPRTDPHLPTHPRARPPRRCCATALAQGSLRKDLFKEVLATEAVDPKHRPDAGSRGDRLSMRGGRARAHGRSDDRLNLSARRGQSGDGDDDGGSGFASPRHLILSAILLLLTLFWCVASLAAYPACPHRCCTWSSSICRIWAQSNRQFIRPLSHSPSLLLRCY